MSTPRPPRRRRGQIKFNFIDLSLHDRIMRANRWIFSGVVAALGFAFAWAGLYLGAAALILFGVYTAPLPALHRLRAPFAGKAANTVWGILVPLALAALFVCALRGYLSRFSL